jgi:hypothetical protein
MAIETTFSGSGQLGEVKSRDRGTLPEPGIPQEIGGVNADKPSNLDRTAIEDGTKVPAPTEGDILATLEGYRVEAEYARLAGPNSRDMTWLQNLDLYWNRFDFSNKANWQAREILPEFPLYVDRFAAALKMALLSSAAPFEVHVNGDEEGDIAQIIKKSMTDVILPRIGRTSTGHRCAFPVMFEEAMKYGALMMCATVVTARVVDGCRQVCIENVDPYNVWLDPTGRGLYRIRRLEMDLSEFQQLARKVDGKGVPLYKIEEMKTAGSTQGTMEALQRAEREKRTGTAQWQTSNRRPVLLHEFYGTLIDASGNTIGENVLAVWANSNHLVRVPEKNPFWHGRDWLICAPVLPVPGAPYGRAYVENFATICRTLNELTNLILDAVFTSALKAFAVVPSMLEDPSQIDEGVYPNVVFRLQDGAMPQDFLKEVNLGMLPPDVMQIWQTLKGELQEGAAFQAQQPIKSHTSAEAIGNAGQQDQDLMKSIASNIEGLYLEPFLDTVWKTAIQHIDPKDEEWKAAVGETWFDALTKSKKQFAKYHVRFHFRGISALIDKGQKLQKLMQLLQVIGQNQMLMQQLMQDLDPAKVIGYLFELFEIDKTRVFFSPREKQANMIAQQQQQQAQARQQLAQQALTSMMGGGGGGKPPAGGARPGGPATPAGGPMPSAGPAGGQVAPTSGGPPPQGPAGGR